MGTKKKLPEIFFSNAHMIAFLKYKQNLKLIGENFYYSLVIIFRSSVIIKKHYKTKKKLPAKRSVMFTQRYFKNACKV